MTERARWAVEQDSGFTKVVDGDIVNFENIKNYQDYKEKYFKFYDNYNIIPNKTEKEVKIVGYIDITEDMYREAKPNSGSVKKQKFVVVNGIKYVVDGHNVIYKHNQREIEVAQLLNRTFGGKVKILPSVNFPQGIKTPDYLFRGERTDLKIITSKRARDCIKVALRNKEEQADNFIIDNTEGNISNEDVIKQIIEIYGLVGFLWVNKIYLLDDKNFVKVFKRK